MNFTIYRDSWRRGGDHNEQKDKYGDTLLLHPINSMMCCLGQAAIQLGCHARDIAGIGEPGDIGQNRDALDGVLLNWSEEDERFHDAQLTKKAIPINDDGTITDYEREVALAKLFEHHGHQLEFVDGLSPWPVRIEATHV